MAPPPHSGPPQPGLMSPGAGPALDHASAIRSVLWIVAGVLAAVELFMTAVPSS